MGAKKKAGSDDNDSHDEEAIADARKHFKEGQKNICPPKGDATLGFYESLLEENPDSLLALRYCIENGVFGRDKHNKLLKRFEKLKADGAYKRGAASAAAAKAKAKAMKKEVKKEVKQEVDEDKPVKRPSASPDAEKPAKKRRNSVSGSPEVKEEI